MNTWARLGIILLGASAGIAPAASVTLVETGATRCCVVVQAEKTFAESDAFNWAPKTTFLRWAAEDLTNYLSRMSGAVVPLGTQAVEGLIPIYVGCAPQPPKPKDETPYGDAYVIDVTPKGVILHGESRRAVCYAAADLLHGLGVRWYGPTEMGEVVPSRPTLELPVGRTDAAPDYITRRIWCRPPDELRWMYRNRLGDATIPSGHATHGYGAFLPGWKDRTITNHPDYYARVDGKPAYFPNMANPEVVRIYAKRAIEIFREGPRGGAQGGKQARGFITISPDDGYLQDERPEVVAMNSPGREPILGMPSFSDAWFDFVSRVCREVEKQAPGLDFKFGSLAYMNYLLPPKKAPDPHIVPVIAPIAFNRYVSMGTPGAVSSELLEQIVRGWTEISPRVGMYLYNFNLADMAMPYSRRVHWTKDIPKLRAMGIRDLTVESHPNWHTMMPANYVAARLLWDTKADVNAMLDEFYPGYYGPAAAAMRRYDTTVENAYEITKVFAGATWGMHRILTPEVMTQLEQALVEAEKAARGKGIYEQRVEVVRFSLSFAKIWFKARDALNRYDLAEAEKQGAAFIANYQAGYAKYPLHFGKNVSWSPNIERYFELFHNRSFKDAGRVARDGTVVYRIPDELPTHLEAVEGGAKPSGAIPDREKAGWKPMRTFSATLDEQGLPLFRGVLWYRHEFELPPDAQREATYRLWFGGVDSRVHVWLNGQDVAEAFAGSFRPVEFDITAPLKPTGRNELLISVDNTFPNDIGTGGIIRPVVIYVPKAKP